MDSDINIQCRNVVVNIQTETETETGSIQFTAGGLHYIGPGSAMELYDLIQEFEISLYFSTVLLKYLTVIIGLFTVLVMIVRCYIYSICIAAK